MRDILFRGKRVDNGEWIYGHYGEYFNEERNVPCISVIDAHALTGSLCYDVVLQSVGDYTGLTDKNGKKIFENDIIEYDETKNTYYQIVWINSGWGHKELDTGICELFPTNYGHNPTCFNNVKIISNIFDNPELLEVE